MTAGRGRSLLASRLGEMCLPTKLLASDLPHAAKHCFLQAASWIFPNSAPDSVLCPALFYSLLAWTQGYMGKLARLPLSLWSGPFLWVPAGLRGSGF